MEDLFNDVCTMYGWTRSVNETAQRLGLSTGKVRKILITEGYDMGTTAQMVKELSEKGLSVKEMAVRLGRSEKTVLAYLPYSKGQYMGEERTASALRSDRYRRNRRMLEYSDRVLKVSDNPYYVAPSSRDILVYGGFFQFNLSRLMELSRGMEKVPLDLKLLQQWTNEDEDVFDEPPIVIEFNPTVAFKKEFVLPPDSAYPGCYCLLNYHRQAFDLIKAGMEKLDVYMFRMEEYLPFVTKHYKEFARYWNEKLNNMVCKMH